MEGATLPPSENECEDDDLSNIGQFDGCDDVSILLSESEITVQSNESLPNPIPILVSNRSKTQAKPAARNRNLKTVKR